MLLNIPYMEHMGNNISGWWFQPTPLKNMSSSVGIIIPNIWKVIKNVPNHQPVLIIDLVRPEIEPEIEILL